jgi:DNA repair protein RadD
MKLREYQSRGLDAARKHYRAGKRAVLMVAPTGAGKTVMIAAAAAGHHGKGGATVVLVPRIELVRQSLDKLWKTGVRDLGAITAQGGFNPTAKVLVCSIQTLLARDLAPAASLVVPDEAHHYLSDEWSKVLAKYDGVRVLGFTATPMRADGTGLKGMFDALEVVATNRELVEAGHLVPIDVVGPHKRLEGSDITAPVEAYEKHGGGRPFVLFASSKVHGLELSRRLGDGVRYIDGETPADLRKETLDALERGKLRGVVNVFVLTEGWDCPLVEVCIIARGCASVATFIQMVCRVRRPSPGKERALLIDCKGAVFEHGLPDDERVFSLDGRPITRSEKLAPLRQCPRCAAVFELAPVCVRCWYEFPVEKRETREVKTELRRVDAVTPEGSKRAFLRGQLSKARALGHKPGWAAHRFRARFGHWPQPAWLKEEASESPAPA